jgi:endonuclease YncB( thermonuclease family)
MKALSVATYAALRKKIEEILLLGQQKIQEAKVQTYWETGRYINEHLQTIAARSAYGEKVIRRLADDVQIHYSVLQKCSQFAEKFPQFKIVSARRQLTWAHYRALLTVPDKKKRLELADRAVKENWVSRDLEVEVRNLNWESRAEALEGKPPSLLPVPKTGPFFTYRILDPKTVQPKEEGLLLIDLGFSSCRDLDAVTSRAFKPFEIIESVKTGDDQYKLQRSDKTPDDLYTYNATVEKVVDGDTLRVIVDLGFNVRTRQYIRLKGIDCPEMDTPEGKAAKNFVENALAGLGSITLKTVKPDKYDRYLGDVFLPARSLKASAVPTPINRSIAEIGAVLTTANEKNVKVRAGGTGATGSEEAGQQQYLNNLLLEKGMAIRVRN